VQRSDHFALTEEFLMSIFVSGKTYVPAPEGLYRAGLVDVVALGEVDTHFGKKHKVRLAFELEVKGEDGRHFIVSKTYTLSLHEKSSLHKDLRGWRGRPFTRQEMKRFDLEALIGTPCKVVITHVERDGTVYGNVTTIMKAEKGKEYAASGLYARKENNRNGNSNSNNQVDSTDPVDCEDVDAGEDDTIPF
jgi:hypothetical protein